MQIKERQDYMTEYVLARSTEKPEEIDTTISPTTVFQRRNVKRIAASGKEGKPDYSPAYYEYEERQMSTAEYAQYIISMEQAQEINDHSDQEAIDNYTRQLMDEGVI